MNAPAVWAHQSVAPSLLSVDDDVAEADEPPDLRSSCPFQKTIIHRPSLTSSLLTQALHGLSDDEDSHGALSVHSCRRSFASTASVASTADLTSDTGFTSASRASSLSPGMPAGITPRLANLADLGPTPNTSAAARLLPDPDPSSLAVATLPQAPQKKRCISFACSNLIFVCPGKAAKASDAVTTGTTATLSASASVPHQTPPISAAAPPRKSCIKFACPNRVTESREISQPSQWSTTPFRDPFTSVTLHSQQIPRIFTDVSTPTLKKSPSRLVARVRESAKQSPVRKPIKPAGATAAPRRRFIQPTSDELRESSHFHEFALTDSQDDEWVEEDKKCEKTRITMGDILSKEKSIRRLIREASQEADEEDDDDDNARHDSHDEEDDQNDCDDDDDQADSAAEEGREEEQEADQDDPFAHRGRAHDVHDWASDLDGYRSDEETGFAESEDENDHPGQPFWTATRASTGTAFNLLRANNPLHNPSYACSTPTECSFKSAYEVIPSRIRTKSRPMTPDLPDSTDFVCGTLDEDRPLEAMYLSRLEAKKRRKLHLIPQDIDPSFPTSDPDDVDEDDDNLAHALNTALDIHLDQDGSSRGRIRSPKDDDPLWLHGEMEDLHHEADRPPTAKQNMTPARRFHSPPPTKRYFSPPVRGRSPRRHAHQPYSPRRLRSPPPPTMAAANGDKKVTLVPRWLECHRHNTFAGFAGPSEAKSLPKRPGMLLHDLHRHHAHGRPSARVKPAATAATAYLPVKHQRGAIDIIKGLEQRRRRRRDKFFQMYCDRARRGQKSEHKPQPGLGAEKMKEVGLHVPKREHCAFVISI